MAKKTVKIPQADASTEQLRWYAGTLLGIPLQLSDTREILVAKILVIDDSGSVCIEMDDESPHALGARKIEIGGKKPSVSPYAPPPLTDVRSRSSGQAYNTDPHVIMVIAKEEKEGGDEPVAVSHNGSAMWIPRGQLVEIPYRFYDTLMKAVKTIYTQIDAAGTLQGREVPAYPVDVKWKPSEDVVAEWVQRMNTLQAVVPPAPPEQAAA